jgi:hypothetical protein
VHQAEQLLFERRNESGKTILNPKFLLCLEYFMAPRANWKGFLRLSLVTCPVALYPATSDSEKVSFNQINKKTGHRIKYLKVDADTGEEVPNEEIIKGYKVDRTLRSNPPVPSTSTNSSRRAT